MSSKPIIVVLSLAGDQQGVFNDIYGRLLGKLRDRADLRPVQSASQAADLLKPSGSNSAGTPRGVFVTDSGLTLAKHDALAQKVVDYARGGGRVVMGGLFSSYASPTDISNYFAQRWNLPWRSGSYQRTTVTLNPAAGGRPSTTSSPGGDRLPASFSQKAVFLKNVDKSAAWYLPTPDSVTESHVFKPSPVQKTSETPVAFVRVGNGWLGYVGDVNAEEGTDAVVLGMLGLI
jgi:hypothetical protein